MSLKTKSPRILVCDIETAPLEVYAWGIWEVNVGLDMIKTDWSILSVASKWLGAPTTTFQSTGGRGARHVRDDRKLLQHTWQMLDEADIVVGQNAKKFDIKKLNARFLQAGMPPYSPIRVIDTMLAAKRYFAMTSNKLAFLSQKLTESEKSSHKKFPGFELWSECLKDNSDAWKEMKLYNIQDVVATEELYLKLRPWMTDHPNLGVYTAEAHSCPNCSSTQVQKRGTAVTNVGIYTRYHCQTCGAWSRGRTMINTKEHRAGMLR